jgi:lipoprotein LprG
LVGLYGRRTLAFLATLIVLAVAGGCGGPADLPPDQIIQKAAPAMQAASSFHFTVETTKPPKPLPGLFINGAQGDVVKPDKLMCDVQATYAGLAITAKVVVDGKSQYMTDPVTGQWTPMSSALNVIQFFDPAKGISDIMANVKDLKSDGTENINGADTYRLKATVQAAVLRSLSPEVTATGTVPATLWIGSSDFLIRKVKLEGALVGDEPANTVRTLSFQDYNKPVKIETPIVRR